MIAKPVQRAKTRIWLSITVVSFGFQNFISEAPDTGGEPGLPVPFGGNL